MDSLQGIRVLDVSSFISGPWACQLLAEYGADVVKVENPDGGDPFRSLSPDLCGPTFRSHNMHKRSVTLDLKAKEGAELFKALAATADVLVENFRPGTMDRLGLGYGELSKINPRLIYCAVSGFGTTGPYSHRPAYDTVIQASSGLFQQSLDPVAPKVIGPNFADSISAQTAVTGILAALYARERHGRGVRIDVPMVDALIAFLTNPIFQYFQTGKTPNPYQRPSASQCFVLKCADGRLTSVHLSTPDKFWNGLMSAIEKPQLRDDPRFATRADRGRNYLELGEALVPIFAERPRAEWHALFEKFDVPYAPINAFEDLDADPQIKHLGTFAEMRDAQGEVQRYLSRPVIFDGDRTFPARPAPRLGEHTQAILATLGCSEARIEELRQRKVI